MASSPFDLFRRNQRQLMVVMTGLAMFAFVFLDSVSMQSGELPRSLSVILVAMLCAGGMWIIGNPRGRGSELALYGAIVGGVLGYFGLRQPGQVPVVETAIGSFDRDQFQEIAQRRAFANRFVQVASNGQQQGFGATDDASLVQRAILLDEARKRGIAVSNDAVSNYISEITENKLAQGDYRKMLRDLGLPEAELFAILKEELEIQLALLMDLPAATQTTMAPLHTPLSYWNLYRMLQVRQALDVAAVPVDDFVSKVPEPNDTELQAFFERYKNLQPSPSGEPGFLQDQKVNLAYVSADFEAFESQAQEPTDEEVVAYYEANKANYRVFDIPDDGMGDMPEFGEDAAPASALEPVNRLPSLPAPSDLPPPASSPGDSAPADAANPARPPAPALPEGAAEAAVSKEIPIRLVSFQNEEAAKPEEGATETEKPDAATPPSPTEAKPAAAKEDVPPQPAAETPAEPKLTIPNSLAPTLELPPGPAMEPEPKYRDLDDGLKLEIRETMLRERAFEAMGVAVDKAFDEMTRLSDDYLSVFEPEEIAKKGDELTERLKAYAAKNNLRYAETGLMTSQELQTSVSEPIGQAMDPSNSFRQRPIMVAQQAFANDTLFYPQRADSLLRDQRYSYWKIKFVDRQVPTLAEVKDQVVEAWKVFQARPLAKKRAEELAEQVNQSKQPMLETLSKATVTGAEDGTPLSVRETPRFSWMSMPRNLPFQFNPNFMPPPQLSQVDGVAQPGNAFMKTVFEELDNNEAGVALNEPQSIYYVVQVKQRDATPAEGGDNLGLRALQQQFLMEGREGFDQGPYLYLSRPEMMDVFTSWRKSFESRYAIQWMDPEEMAATSDE